MPEPTLIVAGLKTVAPMLLKVIPWALKKLPRNAPAIRAITITSERYSSRVPNLESALEAWIKSESFQSVVESLESAGISGTDLSHVELFVTTTGLNLGTIPLETAGDILTCFYGELCNQFLDSEHGNRILGAKIDALHRGFEMMQHPSAAPRVDGIPYRPSLEADFGLSSATDQDRKAEVQLDLVKDLIVKRKAGTALELLSSLQRDVDDGKLSVSVRFRFFVNKGVSLMLNGNWDQAELELGRAQTLEPNNPKALINLAQVLRFKGQPQDALPYIQKVLAGQPTESTANALRLACLHQTGEQVQIASILGAQPELAEDANCQYALAYIAYEQEKFSEAEHYLRQHNEKEANYPEAWELMGRVILLPAQRILQHTTLTPNWIPEDVKGRLEEAAYCFSRAEQLLTDTESHRELNFTLNNRGLTRMMLGLDEEARQDFERALQLDPSLDETKRNLGNHFLKVGKPIEAVRIFQQIKLPAIRRDVVPLIGAAFLEMNKPLEARAVLEPECDSVDERQQLFVKEMLLVACQKLKDHAACFRLVQSLSSQRTNPEACRILADYYVRELNHEQAHIFAQLAVDASTGTGSGAGRYRLRLADILYRAGKFSDASDEYEQIQIPLDESPDCLRRLIALFRAGRIWKALQVAQSVRTGRPAVAGFSEVEALIFECTGDLDRANALRHELLSAGISPPHQKLRIAINHTRRNNQSDAAALTMEVGLSLIAENPDSLRDAAMLRTLLELPDALLFAYHFLQHLPDDPDSHLFYIRTFFRREAIDRGLLQPNIVGLDCVVTLRSGSEHREWTVVEGESDTMKHWLSIDHSLAKEMLGKRTGDKFQLNKGELFESIYVVEAVKSKYVHAFQDCMGRYNERFPANYGLQRIEVDPNDLTKIAVLLNRQKESAERIIDLYRAGKMPACSIARLFGKSNIEMFRSLVEDRGMKILSFNGGRTILQTEEAAILPESTLILEASALVTLHSLGLLDKLSGAFGVLSITQFTVDALSGILSDIHPTEETSYLFSDSPGHIQMVSRTSGEVVREKQFYQQLLHFLETKCTINAPAGHAGLEHFASAPTREVLGTEALATIAVALETHHILVSDDLPLRLLVENESDLNSVSTLALLRHLRSRRVLSADQYHRAVQWLVEHGFGFVSVDKDDITWILIQNQWLPKTEVADFLQCLTGPDCDASDAIRIGLDVLHDLWNRTLPTSSQHLTSDLLIRALVTGRNPIDVLNRLRALNHRRSAIWTPAMDRIHSVIDNWARRFSERVA